MKTTTYMAILTMSIIILCVTGCEDRTSVANQNAAPSLVGKQFEAAKALLNDSGHQLGNVQEVFSGLVDPGFVVAQEPAAGTECESRNDIFLVVSKGPDSVANICTLLNESTTQAEAELSVDSIFILPSDPERVAAFRKLLAHQYATGTYDHDLTASTVTEVLDGLSKISEYPPTKLTPGSFVDYVLSFSYIPCTPEKAGFSKSKGDKYAMVKVLAEVLAALKLDDSDSQDISPLAYAYRTTQSSSYS